MAIREEQVTLVGDGRPLNGFVAAPAGRGPFPALVVIHEIWGLDDHIRDVTRRFAAAGYLALAPDLYTGELAEAMSPANIMAGMQFLRQAPPEVQRDPRVLQERIGDLDPAERRALLTLMRVMSPEQRSAFAHDLVGAVGYLGGRPDVAASRLGSLGFCMGGGLSAHLATMSPQLRACVIFYGDSPPLDAVGHIRAAVLGLYGGEDRRITDTVPALAAALAAAKVPFAYHVYPGARHAFFNDSRPATYDAAAAADAWQRVLDFLGRELGPTT